MVSGWRRMPSWRTPTCLMSIKTCFHRMVNQKTGSQALFLFGHQLLLGSGQALSELARRTRLFLADDYRENFRQHHPGPEPARQSQSVYPRPGPTRPIHGSGRTGHPDRHRAGRAHVRERRTGLGAHSATRRGRTSSAACAPLGINDLEAHIKFEINFTPLSWRKRYNLVKGSTHGLCHNLTQLGYFRPDYQHPHYHNLYFVGRQHPSRHRHADRHDLRSPVCPADHG